MTSRRILIADDEPYVVELVGHKLEEAGFDVTRVSTGREAFDSVERSRPDLIITDYQMPVMTGLELGEELFKRPEFASIPLIMLTARGFKIPPPDLSRTNIIEMYPKPFSPRELVDRVAEALAELETGDQDGQAQAA